MDSDDNMLVIDEWHEGMDDMEVSSTTPSKSDSPVARRYDDSASDARENEATAKVSSESTTKSSTSHNTKHKESGRDKSKSKEERRKSVNITPNSEKKRSVSKRPHAIRLTDAVFKENILNITAQKHQFYNLNYYIRNDTLYAEIPSVYPAPPPFSDLSLAELLNWPDIRMEINFEYMTFSREIRQNCNRDLVFGDDVMIDMDFSKNPTQTRQLVKVQTNKTNPMVSKDVFDMYVSSLMEAAPNYEVGPSRVPEIEQSFRKMLDDVAKVPSTSIQTKITHSRFLNEQRYFCVFENGHASNDGMKVRLREVINPEVNFEIPRCTFISDRVAAWQSALYKELEDILLKRTPQMKSHLSTRFKKCLAFKCEKCNEVFEGALWAVKLKDHIKQKHFVAKEFTCVKCLRKWDQLELLKMEWKHDCKPR